MRSKTVIILLLLVVPLLMTVQSAQSQAYTTFTTMVTSVVTNSTVNSVIVGTTVATSSQQQSTVIFAGAIQLPPTHGVCGQFSVQPFNASEGTIAYGNVTSDKGVNFYLLTDAAYQTWSIQVVAGGVCTPSNALVTQQNVTSYNFRATIASAGKYEFVLHNLSHFTVKANLSASAATLTIAPVTMMLYSTVTQSNLLTLVQTSTGVLSTQGTSSDYVTWLLVVLIVVVLGAVAYWKLRQPRTKG